MNAKVEGTVKDSAKAVKREAYVLQSPHRLEEIAKEEGATHFLHLWLNKALGTQNVLNAMPKENREIQRQWLNQWWSRISDCPGSPARGIPATGRPGAHRCFPGPRIILGLIFLSILPYLHGQTLLP